MIVKFGLWFWVKVRVTGWHRHRVMTRVRLSDRCRVMICLW